MLPGSTADFDQHLVCKVLLFALHLIACLHLHGLCVWIKPLFGVRFWQSIYKCSFGHTPVQVCKNMSHPRNLLNWHQVCCVRPCLCFWCTSCIKCVVLTPCPPMVCAPHVPSVGCDDCKIGPREVQILLITLLLTRNCNCLDTVLSWGTFQGSQAHHQHSVGFSTTKTESRTTEQICSLVADQVLISFSVAVSSSSQTDATNTNTWQTLQSYLSLHRVKHFWGNLDQFVQRLPPWWSSGQIKENVLALLPWSVAPHTSGIAQHNQAQILC